MLNRSTHNDFRVNCHAVLLPHLPAGFQPGGRPFRLVQVSDLHFYEYTDPTYYEAVSSAVNSLQPDLVVATGDLIHYGSRFVPMAGEFLAGLQGTFGRYAVVGNHDYADGARSQNVQAMLRDAGYTVLLNGHVCLQAGSGHSLWLCGLDDYKRGRPDLARTLDGVPREAEAAVLMLAHNPLHFDVITRDRETPVDLVLSGHTHAGHIDIPPLRPLWRLLFQMKYRYGFYQKNRTRLYVTSGLGSAVLSIHLPFYCRAFPRFRYNTHPEIAVFDLTSHDWTSGPAAENREINQEIRPAAASPRPEKAR